jgi:hypothetical protein
MWHQSRVANVACAWSWRICEIAPVIRSFGSEENKLDEKWTFWISYREEERILNCICDEFWYLLWEGCIMAAFWYCWRVHWKQEFYFNISILAEIHWGHAEQFGILFRTQILLYLKKSTENIDHVDIIPWMRMAESKFVSMNS